MMEKVRCGIHNIEFLLPTTEKELVSGKLHDDVERFQEHHEKKS